MPQFSHLHVHTQYSLLDGAANIKSLIKKAKADHMPAVAITDHGNMFGAFEFYEAATKEGLKPILGCEFYLVQDRHVKQFSLGTKDKRYHQLLLARDHIGYKNLAKLCSLGYLEGMYSKYPRIDKELLLQHHEGLIATSCCLGAEIPQAIMYKGEEEAEKLFQWWHNLFGENFYVELQRHNLTNVNGQGMSQEDVNQTLIKFARKYDVKIIATNDSHYVEQDDANAHDILLCINTGEFQSTPKATEEEGGKGFRFGFPNDEFYFKSTDEMAALFKDIPEALDNTNLIIDSINTPKLAQDVILPNYTLPEGFATQGDYLRHLAYAGAKRRYGDLLPTEIQERLQFELDTICGTPFPGYFLIVQDFTTAARDMGVWVGPGRGSAAGSLVAYALGITNVDPVKYDLLFERFLNPERVSMPDIDIDFDDVGRERVFDYVAQKYGQRRMAQIITYGTMAAKSSIRDVGRVLQYPLAETDKLSKMVPNNLKLAEIFSKSVEEFKKDPDKNLSGDELDGIKQLQTIYHSTEPASKVLKDAAMLEGSVRNTGVHACGIIIAPEELTEYVPVSRAKDSNYMQVQFDVNVIEKAGLLKMDFLGLSTLTILKDTVAMIKENHGVDIDPDQLPLDDAKTYELFQKGETVAIFQFESPGMQKYMRDLKPTQFGDLIAMNALYRPGPLKYIPDFIDRKHGRKAVEYDLPIMEEYLKETYGITVYQEQVMLLSQKIAGFSKGKADELRKAMGKKKKDIIDKLKGDFMEGALKNGHPKDKLEKIYSDWEEFAAYAFNKSHSTCYAYIAFQTAYLKTHYPAEYMAAMLKSSMGDIKKIQFYMEECQRMGLKVLGPDINKSRSSFTVSDGKEIRFGMGAIKGVGEGAVEEILKDRDANGPYTSIFDLVTRVPLRSVNKKNLESLARAGAFDFDNRYHRAQYFVSPEDGKENGVELAIKYGTRVQDNKKSGQSSLFGGGSAGSSEEQEPKLPPVPKMSLLEECSCEKEMVGIYLSKHPMDDYKFEFPYITTHLLSQLDELQRISAEKKGKEHFQIMGIITGVKEQMTSTGRPMGRFTLMDFEGSYEFVLYEKDWIKYKNLIGKDYTVIIQGVCTYVERSGRSFTNILNLSLAADLKDTPLFTRLIIDLPLKNVSATSIFEEFFTKYPGNIKVVFNLFDGDGFSVSMNSRKSLALNEEVMEALCELGGKVNASIKKSAAEAEENEEFEDNLLPEEEGEPVAVKTPILEYRLIFNERWKPSSIS